RIAILGDQNLPRLIERGLPGAIDSYSEYIDRARFADPSYDEAFCDFLRVKYRAQHFDVVIALQDVATEFLERHRDDLFAESPLVFYANSARPTRVRESTGLVTSLDLAATVALAVQIQPDTQRVFIVNGSSGRDRV